MKPSLAIAGKADLLRRLAAQNNLANPRIFGSTASGEDCDGSDLDILVDGIAGITTLMNMATFKIAAEKLLGVSVDVRTPKSIHESFRDVAIRSARPL
jgi:uncharacterized protein